MTVDSTSRAVVKSTIQPRGMRRAVTAVAAACLLCAPTVLAFFSGGYFGEPRVIAGVVVWTLVLVLAVIGPAPLPHRAAGRLALGGLGALTVWSAISISWAPLGGPAAANVQRLVLYTGALMLAIGVFRSRPVLRAAEPALAAGATVVIGYGLAGRLLPGIVELARSQSAGGRLEQPITYWNGEGALAAVGLVLCARLAGDRSRGPGTRAAAAAAAVPLAAGVYLSYSRGAIAVAVLGLVVVLALAPSRAQLRASALALGTGVAAAACSAALPGVASLEGSHAVRDGALGLAALVVLAAAAAVATHRWAGRPGEDAALPGSRWIAPAAAGLVALAAVGLVAGGLAERPGADELASGAQPGRLASTASNRFEYWRVGAGAFARHPLAGVGSGGFRVEWLRERPIPEAVRDAHSLEVEVAAELGIVGLAAFLLVAGGVAAAGRDAVRRRRAEAAGPCAAVLAWFLHASIDWDWQLPAVSLPAIVLAGALVVLAEEAPDAPGDVSAVGRSAHPAGAAPPVPAGPSQDRSAT
jgi:hypothetical protein